MIAALEPVLSDMSKSNLWRNKKTVLEFIVKIAEVGGQDTISKEAILKIIDELVRDNYESVREIVIQTIQRLKELLGEDWVIKTVMPEIEK